MALAVLLGQARSPRAGQARLQTQLTHDAADELGAARHAPAGKLGMDPAVAVSLVGALERVGDQRGEPGPTPSSRGIGPPPSVEEP